MKILILLFALILTVAGCSAQTLKFTQGKLVPIDSINRIYIGYGLMIAPEFKGNPTIDDIRCFIKTRLPLYEFDAYASTFKVDPRFKGKIFEVGVRIKYWKENYTFNEFRKLIYE